MPKAIKNFRIGHTKLKIVVQSMGYKVKMTSEESKKLCKVAKIKGIRKNKKL
ncbi:hypothetical protein JFL43_19575 [Viridibacillus sp. YIM B01967]|uniref:Uncharacterized protein n=1 Tax=Viridibacillus soli TaxID=2798301 RepID=A0ABS1HC39_9BACL|nr:hypothetical protein [Viridibacillus soli]MBK3497003.1 hypothetical protein [Viridibacillus soli]